MKLLINKNKIYILLLFNIILSFLIYYYYLTLFNENNIYNYRQYLILCYLLESFIIILIDIYYDLRFNIFKILILLLILSQFIILIFFYIDIRQIKKLNKIKITGKLLLIIYTISICLLNIYLFTK